VNREEFLRAIDEMKIYEEDYRVISSLMGSAEDTFFVKVLEEVINGNLQWSDFSRIFADGKYGAMLAGNLESQQRLYEELGRLARFRRETLNDPSYQIDPSTTRVGVTKQVQGDAEYQFYTASEQAERSALIRDLLSTDPSDSPVVKASKVRIYSAIQSGLIAESDLLLFARDYIVPISFEGQKLNESDINFMQKNGLTEDQVRKIKALSAFLRRKDLQ
jgi:hypothetical protein